MRMTAPIPQSLLDLRRQFFSFLERRLESRALAEDILQSAYLRALEASGYLRDSESATAWFYRILRNAIIDHYRRRSVESAALDRWGRELETTELAEPELTGTICKCITAALHTLTPSYASLVQEVDLGEASLTEYAEKHRITAGNAAVRAHRARTALRKKLMDCCGSCATHRCLDCTCNYKPSMQT